MNDLRHLAMCWRVERRDGVAIGLTAHDRDLVVDGLVHRAAPGMTPSAVVRVDGLEADTMDVRGALTTAAIDERDLVAGRWDGAGVRVFAIDWRDGSGRVDLGSGAIGAVEMGDGGFTAELLGATAALDRAVVEETSPECRAELGDRRCRVATAGRRRFARVVASDGGVLTLDTVEPVADAYGGGRLRWFGGANGGMVSGLARSEGATVTLRGEPAFAAEVGVLVEVVEGCDKSIADLCGAIRQCGELSRRAVSAGGRPADAVSGGVSAVAAAARAMVGTRFRPQGRGCEGVDCVGLVAVALRAGGYGGAIPRGYPLRGGDPARVTGLLDAALARAEGEAPGDVLLCASGPGQLHLAVRVTGGIVHADAGLGRVVERPGDVPWPILGGWRLLPVRQG